MEQEIQELPYPEMEHWKMRESIRWQGNGLRCHAALCPADPAKVPFGKLSDWLLPRVDSTLPEKS